MLLSGWVDGRLKSGGIKNEAVCQSLLYLLCVSLARLKLMAKTPTSGALALQTMTTALLKRRWESVLGLPSIDVYTTSMARLVSLGSVPLECLKIMRNKSELAAGIDPYLSLQHSWDRMSATLSRVRWLRQCLWAQDGRASPAFFQASQTFR